MAILGIKYFILSKVYTDEGGIKSYTTICSRLREIIHSLKLITWQTAEKLLLKRKSSYSKGVVNLVKGRVSEQGLIYTHGQLNQTLERISESVTFIFGQQSVQMMAYFFVTCSKP